MSLIAAAIVPIVIILAAGLLLNRRFLPDPGFWRGLEWMTYRVFTPALFITTIADADLGVVPVGPLLASLAAPITLVGTLVVVLRRPMRANGPQLTSLVQGSIRINTYIGLVFATALHGNEGVATFALASAVVVPLVNVICVSTLVIYGERPAAGRRSRIWLELLGNPLIQGCAIGLALNATGVLLPEFLAAALTTLAAPALACGTFIAGAAIRFTLGRRDILDIGLAALLKLIVLPFTAAAIAISLGVSGATLTAVVLICAVPTAPSAYVLASRMGGDTRLMAAITGVQTILAIGTLPAVLMLTDRLAVMMV